MKGLCKWLGACAVLSAYPYGFGEEAFQPPKQAVFQESWRWTELEFLAPHVVRQASQTPDGGVWFGVLNGVVEYDGYKATPHLFSQAGWEAASTLSIHAASNGIVYVLTKDFAACLAEGEWTHLFDTPPIGYSSGSRIAEAADSSIWYGTPGGLYRVRERRAERVDVGSGAFSSAWIDHLNRLWTSDLGSREILRFDLHPATGLPEEDPFRLPTERIIGAEWVVEYEEGGDGRIWITSNSDLHALRYVQGGRSSSVLKDWSGFGPTNKYLLERSDGSLWVITENLIAVYDQGAWSIHRMENYATWFSFVHALDEDTLLLGGHTDKTYRFDASQTRWQTLPGLNFQCRDREGNDWFLSADKRAVRHNPQSGSWTQFNSEDGLIENPNRIFVDDEGWIWASGSHGGAAAVSWLTEGSWHRQTHARFGAWTQPLSPYQGWDGVLYFGAEHGPLRGDGSDTLGGLLKYWVGQNGPEYSYVFPPEVPRRIFQIGQTPDQTLWLGGGGSLWKKEGNQPARIVEDYRGNWVDNLCVDGDGALWILAWRTGVSRRLNDRWEVFSLPGYRTSNKPAALYAGKNSEGVWLATTEGLNRFDNQSWSQHIRFPELEFNRDDTRLIASPDGSLWINLAPETWHYSPGSDLEQRPDRFKTVRYKPSIGAPNTRIVKAQNSLLESGNTVIEWTGEDAWSQTSAADLQYSYRVNDEAWSPFSRNPQALLQSLSPGTYRFAVRARDLDWNLDPTPAVAEFTVRPYLWKRPWFIAAAFLGLVTIVGLMVLVVRMRMRHIVAIEEFKIDFFTNISHELRTPLSAIIGPLESMLKGNPVQPTRHSLSMIYRNARRMLGLVNQLLEFRKVELGKLTYQPVRSDLVLFLKDVVYAHVNLWERRSQNFEFKVEPEHQICSFDPDKLQHIVTNLISNAIKYTPERGRIAVKAKVLPDTSGALPHKLESNGNQGQVSWLRLEVEDSGIGIAEDRQKLIFKPFYREQDHKRDYQGTGIGLAYTHELVRLWGGKIEVESPVLEGNGTRFTVSLPLLEGDSSSEPVSSFVAKPLEPDREVVSVTMDDKAEGATPPSLLIVDDNADIREFLETELSEQYRILTAENGQEGFDAAKEFHPDLILADLMMPVMDGLKMCSLLRTDKETSHIPILMLTARRSDEFRIKGIEHGADDYFSKPVNIELLKARIHSLLESRRMLRERFSRQVLIQPEEITVTPLDEQFLRKAIAIVQKHMRDEDFDVESFARKMGMGRASLYRKMNAMVGAPPFKFIRSMRLKRAAQLLKSGNYNVSQAMEQVGIEGLSHFGKIFREEFGETPSEYRHRHLQAGEPPTKEPSLLDQSI